MLIKLLKNDFFQTGRMFLWLLCIGIAGGGIGALFTLNQDIGPGQFLLATLWNSLLIIGVAVLQVLGLVMLIVSTNRALFTERGYLTFALPVSSTQLLFSKFAANVVFMLLNIAMAGGLFYVTGQNIARLISNLGANVMDQVGAADMELYGLMEIPAVGEFVVFGVYALAVALTFLILAMMVVLFSLTISHVRPFQAKPGLFIPIFLAASGGVSIFLVSRLSDLVRMNVHLNFGGVLADGSGPTLNVTAGIIMLGLAAGLFFVTDWMMRRKISLK